MIASKRNRRLHVLGFTLVELLVVCLIIGVLIAIAAPNYLRARLRAEEQKAVATLYEFAKAQTAYWFDQDPNAYTSNIDDLTPSYIDVTTDDGDWTYNTAGNATTFDVTAQHTNGDGLSVTLNKDGTITRGGNWPY